MANPTGKNQYSGGAKGKKPVAKSGKTQKANLKAAYQKATKSVNLQKSLAKTNALPGMNSDIGSRGMDQQRIKTASAKAKSIKAAYRKAK